MPLISLETIAKIRIKKSTKLLSSAQKRAVIKKADLVNVRDALTPLYQQTQNYLASKSLSSETPVSDDARLCRFAALYAAEIMMRSTGKPWRVAGGDDFFVPGGFFHNGEWKGHYWATDGQIIVDLAAQQFDESAVVVTNTADPRYKSDYTAKEIASSLEFVSIRVDRWLDATNKSAVPKKTDAKHHLQLKKVGTLARDFLEPCWNEFHTENRNKNPVESPASGMSCHSALLIKNLLKEALGQDWRITGGITREPGTDFKYEKHGDGRHYWLQNNGVIFDLTADQFGNHFDAVTVTDINDTRYLEMPQYSASDANKLKRQIDEWIGVEWDIFSITDRSNKEQLDRYQTLVKNANAVARTVKNNEVDSGPTP